MAILRAHRVGGVCVLGSATPSLESEQLARTRQGDEASPPRPRARAADAARRGRRPPAHRRRPHGRQAHQHAAAPRARGDARGARSRRSSSSTAAASRPSVRCEACGELATCPQCSVALTFHKRAGVVALPLLRLRSAAGVACAASARRRRARARGARHREARGDARAAFPEARVARLDRDVASGKQRRDSARRAMRAREVDILVGTQMVTKGHDLPHVTLVGVDQRRRRALASPTFAPPSARSSSSCRSPGARGAATSPGRVLVQT